MPIKLPTPNVYTKNLSEKLRNIIANDINEKGPMSFFRFMQLALYAPTVGYYRNELPKLGINGDFVTAPEMSPLFSYCVANQCAQILRDVKGGDILELGAGSGVMAADILLYLESQKQLPTRYFILELSAQLKAVQRETITRIVPHLFSRVIWLNELPKTPIKGVIFGNEVLDAMPVHQFVWNDRFDECGVILRDNELSPCVLTSRNKKMISQLERYDIAFSSGYTSEVNLYLPSFLRSMTDVLSRGLLLLIDYGFVRREYYHPDRFNGTLMCHFQHHSHDNPLIYPGIQDITAHVDFTAVAEAADENDFEISGFTHQAGFLMNCGLMDLIAANHENNFQRNQAIMRLISPNEMGELIKVIGLTKKISHELCGFGTMNQVEKL